MLLQILLTPPDTNEYEDIARGETATIERYKLVVVGDEECGKTALLNTLVKSPDFEVWWTYEYCRLVFFVHRDDTNFYCSFQVDDSFTIFDECVTDVKTLQEHVEFTLYEITGATFKNID